MVRNTSGNGPGLPIQVINLPGGRPCIVLSVEDFAALLSLAHLGAARDEATDETRRIDLIFGKRPRTLAEVKARDTIRDFIHGSSKLSRRSWVRIF